MGWGPTKTIAKLANGIAKDHPELEGLCDLTDPAVRAGWYERLEIGEVWGIGRRTEEKLAQLGIRSIADFLTLDPRMARDLLTVVGGRVQEELRGVSCLPLQLMAAPRKGLAVTRSFGRPVLAWRDMREAVAAYAARAAEKLRAEGMEACHMQVFLHTNPHDGSAWHSAQRSARIEPTSDTLALIGEAMRLLVPLWREGFAYAKAGIMLTELVPARQQARLFQTRDPVRSAKTMAALDAVNERFGRGTLRPLATGIARPWGTRQQKLSQRYTTRIEEIMRATTF
ncbi:DUF4113 domain-containing protein [Roseomonas sp. 18066]|uniref:DinB/UmuC family translesion DNA polymerase n=1 Tax=Roseomonas sp. 18066 TaxID=2681412 RepID=UPI001F373487|nr:DUF4113 domain-containing protein [Roseomonas sp. 18066]